MERKKSNFKHYAIGVLIAFGFYLLSSFLGGLINLLFIHFSGVENLLNLFEIYPFRAIVLTVIGLLNHIFFGWLTADMLSAYGWRHNYLTIWSFRSAAIAVAIIATIITPIFFGSASGWLTYITHCLSIMLFGRRRYKIYTSEHPTSEIVDDKQADEIAKENDIVDEFAQPVIPAEVASEAQIEAQNGESTLITAPSDTAKLQSSKTISYCRHCGAKIEGESESCGFCGTRIIKEIEL